MVCLMILYKIQQKVLFLFYDFFQTTFANLFAAGKNIGLFEVIGILSYLISYKKQKEQLLSIIKISSKPFLLQDYNRVKVFPRNYPLYNAQNQTQIELLIQARLNQ